MFCLCTFSQGVANVASGHGHYLIVSSPCPVSPAPPSAQEPQTLHPHPARGRHKVWGWLTFSSMGSSEQGQHKGREEQPHPAWWERSPPVTVQAGAWLRPGPWQPLFAQPAPVGESKQAKVRAGEKGQRHSPTQHPLQSIMSWVCLRGNMASHVCRQLLPSLDAESRGGQQARGRNQF